MRSTDSRSRRWAGVDLRPGCYASFAMSAGRHSRRASVAGMPIQWASPPCSPWHRDPHLGGSRRRMAVPRLTSRTVTAGPGCGARRGIDMRGQAVVALGLTNRAELADLDFTQVQLIPGQVGLCNVEVTRPPDRSWIPARDEPDLAGAGEGEAEPDELGVAGTCAVTSCLVQSWLPVMVSPRQSESELRPLGVGCQNSRGASELGFYPRRSCSSALYTSPRPARSRGLRCSPVAMPRKTWRSWCCGMRSRYYGARSPAQNRTGPIAVCSLRWHACCRGTCGLTGS